MVPPFIKMMVLKVGYHAFAFVKGSCSEYPPALREIVGHGIERSRQCCRP
jgi:hypothetical protein